RDRSGDTIHDEEGRAEHRGVVLVPAHAWNGHAGRFHELHRPVLLAQVVLGKDVHGWLDARNELLGARRRTTAPGNVEEERLVREAVPGRGDVRNLDVVGGESRADPTGELLPGLLDVALCPDRHGVSCVYQA